MSLPRRTVHGAVSVSLILVALLGDATTALANAPPSRLPAMLRFRRWIENHLPGQAIYIKPGVTVGGGWTHESGTDFTLGGEVSVLFWHEAMYAGLVVDGLYDWQRGGARLMVGPELGLGYFGIDGGYVRDFAGGGAHGGAVRGFISVGIAALYVRYTALYHAPDSVDFGLMLKLPLPVWQKRYPWPRCCEELGPPPRRSR
jgi:hypothetical protein